MAAGAARNFLTLIFNQARQLLLDIDDDDEDFFDFILPLLLNIREDPVPRVRVVGYFEQTCQNYSAKEFRRHYRLNREVHVDCVFIFS